MFTVVIGQEAVIDLDEIFVWYESQKENLGFEFIEVFERIVEILSQRPHYTSFILDDARSATLKRFPYQIIYRIDEIRRQVRVIAIVHQHRNPDWFKKRLQNDL